MPHIIWGRCLKQTKLRIQTGNDTASHDSCGVWHYYNAIIVLPILICTKLYFENINYMTLNYVCLVQSPRNYFEQLLVLKWIRIRKTLPSESGGRYETYECAENNFWVDRHIIEPYIICSVRHMVCVRYVTSWSSTLVLEVVFDIENQKKLSTTRE